MRERTLGWTGNKTGLYGQKRLRIYSSEEVHSSIDRAIWFFRSSYAWSLGRNIADSLYSSALEKRALDVTMTCPSLFNIFWLNFVGTVSVAMFMKQ